MQGRSTSVAGSAISFGEPMSNLTEACRSSKRGIS